jgi:hypothetical protein
MANQYPNVVDADPVKSEPPNDERQRQRHARNTGIAGAALIVLGLLVALGTAFQSTLIASLIPLAIGIVFLAWAVITRTSGLFIPGGILTGLGISLLVINEITPNLPGETQGGIVLLGLGLGFIAIPALTTLFTGERYLWALVPGGALTAIGLLLLIGGLSEPVLTALNYIWPVVIIGVGAYLVYRWYTNQRQTLPPRNPT